MKSGKSIVGIVLVSVGIVLVLLGIVLAGILGATAKPFTSMLISYSLVIPGSILIVCPLIKNISQKSQAGIIAKAKAKADENAAEYFCVGSEGRILTVYSDRVSLITRPKLLVGNYANGEKTIFYADCIGVQFSLSGGSRQLGCLQFETASAMASSSSSVDRLSTYYNENTFIWYSGKTGVTNEQMEVVTKYIQEKIANCKQAKITCYFLLCSPFCKQTF